MDCYQVNRQVIKIVHDVYLESPVKSRQLPSEEPSHKRASRPTSPKGDLEREGPIAVCSVSMIP